MSALLGDTNGEDDGLMEPFLRDVCTISNTGENGSVAVAICLEKSDGLGPETEGFDKTSGLAFATSELASKGNVAVDGLGFKAEGFGKTSGLAFATSG